jgi:aminoglycoside phosphotransferase (APT) family kinase protein
MNGDAAAPGDGFAAALAGAMARAGHRGAVTGLRRLTGGANTESWLFDCGTGRFVLRRAPSPQWLAGRSLTMADEARLIHLARDGGVPAPEVVLELDPADGLGSGFVMVCLDGTADPDTVLAASPALARDIAAAMARIHALDPARADHLPVLDAASGIARLTTQFHEAGGDRPIIALGLAWLRAHLPPPVPPRVVHGDLRIGNIMVDQGRLTGVLDWELAHLGDGHEDLAYGCMTVWRFGRLDQPAFGLTDVADLARAYTHAGGEVFDPARFRFWLIYRTVWWALGCLDMGRAWRSGTDRSLERVVVARRAAEQELDLLLLLEPDAPAAERTRPLPAARAGAPVPQGEPAAHEILTAITEWLAATVKPRLDGRERWELAVAQNALGIVRRELAGRPDPADPALARAILDGTASLATPGLLANLKRRALATLSSDMPKYPALARARASWEQA